MTEPNTTAGLRSGHAPFRALVEKWSEDGCDLAPFECAEQLSELLSAAALASPAPEPAGDDALHWKQALVDCFASDRRLQGWDWQALHKLRDAAIADLKGSKS